MRLAVAMVASALCAAALPAQSADLTVPAKVGAAPAPSTRVVAPRVAVPARPPVVAPVERPIAPRVGSRLALIVGVAY